MNKQILLLFALTIIFFYKPLLHPDQFISVHYSDMIHMGTFTKSLFVDTIITHHELPLWNPYIFSGTPFLSNSQSAMFYPLNYLFLLIPSPFIWTFMMFLNTFLMGTFTYLYARKIQLPTHSATISAIIYMFAGTVSTRLYVGHTGLLDAMVWFPLILYFYEVTIQTRKSTPAILAGVTLSIMFFTGHVQFIAYGLLAASLYYILRSLQSKTHYRHLTLLYALSLLVLFSLIPIQLLPSLEFAQYVDRAGGITFAESTTFCITPQWLITFIIPHFFGTPVNSTFWHYGNIWELCAYVGILPLILTAISLKSKSQYKNIFLFLTLFALAFALGKYTPLYSIFYHCVPGFDFLRAPARMLFVYVFSISILAGIGVTVPVPRRMPQFLTIIFLTSLIFIISAILLKPQILSLGYTIVESQYHLHPYLYAQPLTYWYNFASTIYTTILHSAIIFSIIICTITILYKQTNKKGGAEKLIIAIIFIDLFIFASPYIVTSPVPAAPDYIDLLDSRTLSISALPQHIAYPNIQLIDGYDANYLTSYQEFIWQLSNDTPTKQLFLTIPPINNLNILQMLNTSHIITTIPITTPGLTEIYNQNNTIIYKLNNILPRAYFMSNVTFQNGSIYFTLPNEYQEAHITFTSPNEVHMTINTTKPGFLIHSNTHYPGWKAYDNNQSTQIYTANNALQSIYLTAGHRNISFQYDPDSYSIGKLISIISFLIICILLIYYHRNV